MKLIFLSILLLVITSSNVLAQIQKSVVSHKHPKNEVGVAISPAYFVKEDVFTFSMHLHYIRTISETKFGIGASFERIIFAPKHSTYGIVFAYRPIESLSFIVSPGVTYEDANPGSFFALHIETAYEFELGNFHIGPAFEFAYDPNDYHLSLGVHIGYGF